MTSNRPLKDWSKLIGDVFSAEAWSASRTLTWARMFSMRPIDWSRLVSRAKKDAGGRLLFHAVNIPTFEAIPSKTPAEIPWEEDEE